MGLRFVGHQDPTSCFVLPLEPERGGEPDEERRRSGAVAMVTGMSTAMLELVTPSAAVLTMPLLALR